MPKMLLVRIHATAAAGAIALITTFLVASGVTELTVGAGDIRALRHAILLEIFTDSGIGTMVLPVQGGTP